MGMRDGQQERRGGGGTTYRMRQKLVAIGDDFWIEDERGDRVFKVDGKAMRIRDTMVLEDASGRELLKVQERKLRFRDTMEIEDPDGNSVATIKKALITPLRDRFDVQVEDGADLEVQGNIVDHEYRITQGDITVAEVSKSWFRIADTYGVEVAEGQDPVLILAVAAALDSMTHEGR
jgi:uncharacterized protein YxjI